MTYRARCDGRRGQRRRARLTSSWKDYVRWEGALRELERPSQKSDPLCAALENEWNGAIRQLMARQSLFMYGPGKPRGLSRVEHDRYEMGPRGLAHHIGGLAAWVP